MKEFRPLGKPFSMHAGIGGDNTMVATEVTNSWPVPSSYEQRYRRGFSIYQLLGYGILDEYLHIDEAAKEVLGVEFNLPAEGPVETWEKLSYALLGNAEIVMNSVGEIGNDSIIAWLRNIMGTHTLFIGTSQRDATQPISYRPDVHIAIGQGKIEPGDIVVKNTALHMSPSLGWLWFGPHVGLVMRKNSCANIKAAVEARGNTRVIEHFRIVGTCLYMENCIL
jgi:hypothetical protein